MPFGRLSFRGFVAHQHPCTLSGTFWSGKPQTGVNNPYREHPQIGYDPPQFGYGRRSPAGKPVESRSARPGHSGGPGPPPRALAAPARRAGRVFPLVSHKWVRGVEKDAFIEH
jgi:hypothetical protein